MHAAIFPTLKFDKNRNMHFKTFITHHLLTHWTTKPTEFKKAVFNVVTLSNYTLYLCAYLISMVQCPSRRPFRMHFTSTRRSISSDLLILVMRCVTKKFNVTDTCGKTNKILLIKCWLGFVRVYEYQRKLEPFVNAWNSNPYLHKVWKDFVQYSCIASKVEISKKYS